MNIDLKCGDCLELMKNIPDKSIDMILCDLPYGTTACKWDKVIPFEPLWEQYKRIIKDNGAIVLFGSEPFSSYLRMSNIKNYKYDWIWNKKKVAHPLNAKIMPLKKHEIISVFGRGKIAYYPQGLKEVKKVQKRNNVKSLIGDGYSVCGKSNKTTLQKWGNYPSSIIEYSKEHKTFHPTQKPVALLEYLIKTYTNENELVLDSCMGSGSTGVACVNTNRNFIGIELDEKYFNIAKERIENRLKEQNND